MYIICLEYFRFHKLFLFKNSHFESLGRDNLCYFYYIEGNQIFFLIVEINSINIFKFALAWFSLKKSGIFNDYLAEYL